MPHFFREETREQYTLAEHRARVEHPGLLRRIYRRLPIPRRQWLREALFAIAHLWPHFRGRIYNRPLIDPGEVDVIAASTGDLYRWLAGKGIALEVISQVSLVDRCVPRTTL